MGAENLTDSRPMTQQTWYNFKNAGPDKPLQISIHDEIGYYGISAKAFLDELSNSGDATEIHLSINSNGGDVMDGWAIYNAIQSHPAKVTAKIEGLAASMASVIAMAADVIEMPENVFMMIHNATSFAYGDADDVRDMADTLQKVQDGIVMAYSKRTGLGTEEISDLMSHTTYLTAQEAVDKGFADTVLPAFKAAACKSRWSDSLPDGLNNKLSFEEPKKPDKKEVTVNLKLEATIPEPAMSEPIKTIEPKPELSIKDALAGDKPRREEIKAIGARFSISEKETNDAIENGVELGDFRDFVMDNYKPENNGISASKLEDTKNLGHKSAEGYSALKAIREMQNGGSLTGLEAEVQKELSGRYHAATGNPSSGILIPGEWINAHQPGIRNAATVGTGTSGGNTVATEMQGLTGYLKDYSILPTVGASIFSDSEGNLAFPRATAGYSGTWDDEDDAISNADATVAANLTLTPKRIGAGTAITKQLAAQNSVDFEAWMRNELLYAIGTGVDRGAINGTGSSDQPTGLLATSGMGAYSWVGGTSLRGNVVAQWKVLRAANCPMQNVNWLFDENIRANWSVTPQVSNSASFMYEQNGPAASGSVYGYPAYDHTDMAANKVVVGDFSQLMVAMWGGMELIVDPYTKKKEGTIELYVQTFADVGVRQPGCFVIGDNGTSHAGAI